MFYIAFDYDINTDFIACILFSRYFGDRLLTDKMSGNIRECTFRHAGTVAQSDQNLHWAHLG